MKRQFAFSAGKFLSLPVARQHKKCFELIAAIVASGHDEILTAEYGKLIALMQLNELPQSLSDRYHYHIAQSGCSVREDRLLIETRDKDEGSSYLPIAIYLDKLRSAHNIGSILRTVEAYRLGEVYFSKGMVSPQHPQVVKTAMQCAPFVSCYENRALTELFRPIIALETAVDAVPLYDFIFPDSFTIVVGNEEEGCSDEALQVADKVLRLPLYGRKNSLNVANAFAIVAYEVSKQKRGYA